MLWTDAIFITTDDLTRIDSEVPAVAESEGIVLTGSNGIIRGVYEEVTDELSKILITFGGYLGSGDLSPNHLAAVMNIGMGNAVRQKALPSQVVISGEVEGSWNHAKRWAVYWALELFYRDAYNRTVKDRYEGKMRYYKAERQRRVEPMLKGRGIPIVISPLARPAAAYEPDTGIWGPSNVVTSVAPGALGGDYQVVITYLGKDNDNAPQYLAESHPSDPISITVPPDSSISVDILTLKPPDGTQPRSRMLLCIIPVLKATHWNVYVGRVGGPYYLQNLVPIPVDVADYTLASDPVLAGKTAGQGQAVTRYLTIVPTRQRA